MNGTPQPAHGVRSLPAARMAACLLCLALAAPAARALCMDGRAPTVAQEAATASGVVVAEVGQAELLHEDPADPDGITATLYVLKVLRTVRGHMPSGLALYSENTSSRFPMEVGGRYLLFLSRDRNYRYFVDPCGNSGLLAQRQEALRALGGAKSPP